MIALRIFFVLLVLSFTLADGRPTPARAADRGVGPDADPGATVVACHDDWPPYSAREDGRSIGLSVAVLAMAAERAGLSVEFASLPWRRCIAEVAAGRFQLALDAVPRPGFDHSMVAGLIVVGALFAPADKADRIMGLDDLKGLTLAAPHGWPVPDDLVPLIEAGDIRVETPPGLAETLRMMQAGRADFTYSDITSVRKAKPEDFSVEPLPWSLTATRLGYLWHADSDDMRASIEDALRKMEADGSVDRLYRTHVHVSRSRLLDLIDEGAALN